MHECLGIDFGGVVVKSAHRVAVGGAAPWTQGAAAAHDEALDSIAVLVQLFQGRVSIVSKAGPAVEARTRQWLVDTDLCGRTGLDATNVIFCRDRGDKAAICLERGITHFIDDRIHIMQILRSVVPHLFLFEAGGGSIRCPPWFTVVHSWPDTVARLRGSILGAS